MDELNEQIDSILERSMLEEEISLMLEHSLEEEVFLDERSSPQQKKFNSFVQHLITPIRRKIADGTGRNEIIRLIRLRRRDVSKFKGAYKAKALDYVEEMEELLRAREAGTTPTTPPTTPPAPPTTPPAPPTTPPTTTPTTTPEEPDDDTPLTDEEVREVERIRDEAVDLLTKRIILMGASHYNNMRVLNNLGRIVRKYFISKTTLREATGTTGAATTTPTPSGADTADILRQLSREKLIRPEEAAKNYQGLLKKIEADIINDKWNSLRDPNKDKQFNITKRLIMRSATGGLREGTVLKEDKMLETVIDFNELRNNHLNESWLAMFGGWVEHILKAMFGGWSPPVSVRGSQRDINAFAKAVGGEKRYIETARRYGLDHPTTYKSKAKLDVAVKGFEKDTGLTWPFK